ncbi:hypothetical protein KH389_17285 [Pseudomonas qingdaonensis]|uniref:NADH:flavin oxidoreductase/NADH oxidase N-terminal domain-containing protein n=1 Tax=Pseudomonas qingdaonensis TaxID=2056231 RepID=A0ABX8DM76_9PSED|nr:hypothetical protein KH389_17285 [Pseudomonas qingdaonensis]
MNELFTPYDLSATLLGIRVAMAPMTRTRTLENDPYAQRASAGLTTEVLPISEEARGYLYTPGSYTAEHVEAGAKSVMLYEE